MTWALLWPTVSFRPLSGNRGYRYVHRSGQAGVQPPHVSVPSRGNGVIDNSFFDFYGNDVSRFPSPLGEMGLSIRLSTLKPPRCSTCFRPLSGKWGYRLVTRIGIGTNYRAFPSPLGEMGLSIIRSKRLTLSTLRRVSVPSRGNGVIDQ